MNIKKLSDFKLGWVIGNFEPCILKTQEFEFAVKYYRAGDIDVAHVHRIATEVTILVHGKARVNDTDIIAGDVITVLPGQPTQFTAVEDCAIAVIKTPSAKMDKYLV